MAKRDVMLAMNRVPDGSMPKNAYDLHNYDFLHHKLGQMIVVGCRETVPDATYDVGVDAYTLTFPCNTASMADMKENYYFIWVPYNQLVNSSYAFFTQRKDLQSALDYSNEQVPWFPLGDVVDYCVKNAVSSLNEAKDVHGYNLCAGALKLLDLLGYGCYLDIFEAYKNNELSDTGLLTIKTKLNNYRPNVLRIAAYQKAWYCYFRNMQYDTNISPRCFNFDDVAYHETGVTPSWNILDHRSLKNFVEECLQMRYVQYKKDIYTGCMPGTQWGAVSTVTLNQGINLTGIGGSFSGITGNDYNRWKKTGSLVEDGSIESDYNPVKTYLKNGLEGVELDSPNNVDYFVKEERVLNEQSGDYDYGTRRIIHDHTFTGSATGFTGAVASGASLFDVLQLIEAQAVQKWKQKSMLAGQKMQNQYRAHYGVVPRHLEDHYPDFIGSVDNIIDIDKVINQANTMAYDEKTNLGDLGGRGYGASNRRTFRFHSTEHGVILYLKAVVPENLYSSFGLDRANQLINYSDFWQPEYQNIGLEAVSKLNLDSLCLVGSNPAEHPSAQNFQVLGNVLGYAPRNYQLKQYPSKVHGMFNPNRLNSRGEWEPGSGTSGLIPFGFADIQAFVQTRHDLVGRIVVAGDEHSLVTFNGIAYTLSKFYVSPAIANYTFVVDADDYEDTDCFFTKARVICDAVQPLTELGLPQF